MRLRAMPAHRRATVASRASASARALGPARLYGLALLLCLGTSGAKAEGECPPFISPDKPIVTQDWRGVPLAREYYLTARGVWFKLPFGYMNPWPDSLSEPILRQRSPDMPDQSGLEKTAVAFAFWMPSLRWPERNRFNVWSYWPCENGRPPPGEGEYIVVATIEWPWLPNPEAAGYVLPDQQFENRTGYGSARGDYNVTSEHDLLRLEAHDGKLLFYHSEPGDVPRLFLTCTPPASPPGNPLCDGRAWWTEERLGLYLRFRRGDIADWRRIADAARTLALRWRARAQGGS